MKGLYFMILSKGQSFFVYFIFTLLLAYLLVRFVLPYFTPFVIAIILASIIDPFVNFLERKLKIPRGFAVMVVLSILIVVLSFSIITGIVRVTRELEDLLAARAEYENVLLQLVEDWVDSFEEFYVQMPEVVTNAISARIDRTMDLIVASINNALDMVTYVPSLLIVLVVSFIATYFLSKERGRLFTSIMQFAPGEWNTKAMNMKTEIVGATMGFIRAQIIMMFISTVIAYVSLVVLNVRYAILLGIIVGVLDFIPSLGPGLVFTPWALYNIFITGDIGLAVALLIVSLIIIVVRQVLQPKLIGDSAGIHPLLALIAMYLGIRLFGVGGMFIGPLLAIVIKAVVSGILVPMLGTEESNL